MTDNEVIKALECCGFEYGNRCSICPKYDGGNDFCQEELHRYALDLINRQKAEIERLEKALEEQYESSIIAMDVYKSEAIKEFAERLKLKLQWDTEFENTLVFETDIDNLVKEMTEVEK